MADQHAILKLLRAVIARLAARPCRGRQTPVAEHRFLELLLCAPAGCEVVGEHFPVGGE